jgi:hypothetical protein
MVINQNSSGGLIRQLGLNPTQAASSPPLLINIVSVNSTKEKEAKRKLYMIIIVI